MDSFQISPMHNHVPFYFNGFQCFIALQKTNHQNKKENWHEIGQMSTTYSRMDQVKFV